MRLARRNMVAAFAGISLALGWAGAAAADDLPYNLTRWQTL